MNDFDVVNVGDRQELERLRSELVKVRSERDFFEGKAREGQRRLLVSGHYEPSPELARTEAWCKKHLEWTRLVEGRLRCDRCEIERLTAELASLRRAQQAGDRAMSEALNSGDGIYLP